MASQAYEQLYLTGGELGTYTPYNKSGRTVLALLDPVRRVDALGNQSFLTKTYDLFIMKSDIPVVKAGYDTFSLKLNKSDAEETVLRITKILPERDDGFPGDGVGMWHLEAVA